MRFPCLGILSLVSAVAGWKLTRYPIVAPCLAVSTRQPPVLLDSSIGDRLAREVHSLTRQQQAQLRDAEDELFAETKHCKKFLWRGDGLRADFHRADHKRRRALVKGVTENEAAMWRALQAAEACGLEQEHLEEPLRVANSLAIVRAELVHEFAETSDQDDTHRPQPQRTRHTPPQMSVSRAVDDESNEVVQDVGALGRYGFAVLIQIFLVTSAFGVIDLCTYGPLPGGLQLGGPLPWQAVVGIFIVLSLRSRIFSPLDNSRPEIREVITVEEDAAVREMLESGKAKAVELRQACEVRGLQVDRTMKKPLLEDLLREYFEAEERAAAAGGATGKVGGSTERIMPAWTPPGPVFPLMWVGVVAPLRAFSSSLVYEAQTGRFNEAHLNDPVLLWLVLHLCIGDTWNTMNNVERRTGAAVPGVLLVWLSTLFAAKQYYDVVPLAGLLLGATAIWITAAGILVADTWRINNAVKAEPLFPYKMKGTKSRTRIVFEP